MSRRVIFVVLMVAAVGASAGTVFTQGRGGGGQAVSLPDGPGRDLVQTNCTKCHALNLLSGSGGYSRQGWEELIGSMVSLPKDQSGTVAEYLAKNFPETP